MSAAIRNNKSTSSTRKATAGLQDNNPPPRRAPAWRGNSNPPPSVYAPPSSNNAKPQQQTQPQFPPLGNSNPTSTSSTIVNPASPSPTASFAHPPPPSAPVGPASASVTAPDTPLPPPTLIGQTIIVTSRTGQRYQGALVAVPSAADADALIHLKDVRDLASSSPASILKENFSLPVGSIVHWSNPASANGLKMSLNGNSNEFRTDGDISQAAPNTNVRRFISNAGGAPSSGEGRELQAWQPDPSTPYAANALPGHGSLRGDEATFGPGAVGSNGSWDQFATNERMFGVKTSFNEELYTTKLDRTTPDFKERERRAMAIAQEIMNSGTANPHIAEERNLVVDDSGSNEEDKYAGVIRGANAYIPPARRAQQQTVPQLIPAQSPPGTPKPGSPAPTISEVPKVSLSSDRTNATTLIPAVTSSGTSPTPTPSPSASGNASSPSNRPPADLTSTFRDFVAGEKQRLTQKRAAIVKSEMDKRMSELVKFSKDFKLNKPIPEDLLKIIAKDEAKQQQIRDKAAKDAGNAAARAITGTAAGGTVVGIGAGPRILVPVGAAAAATKKSVTSTIPANASNAPTSSSSSGANAVAASATTSPLIANAASAATSTAPGTNASTSAAVTTTKRARIAMVISPIPPFNPNRLRGPAAIAQTEKAKKESEAIVATSTGTDVNSTGISTTSTTTATVSVPKLNVNAPAFRLQPGAPSFKPSTPTTTSPPSLPSVSTSSNQASTSASPANPFFGTRVIKKGAVVHVKDDFNPFKTGLVGGKNDAASIPFTWPYSGKRFMLTFPNLPPPPSNVAPGSGPAGPLHHPSLVHPHAPMSPGAPMPLTMGMMPGMAVPPGGPPVVVPPMPGVPGMNMGVTMIPPGTPSLSAASVPATNAGAVNTANGVAGATSGTGSSSQGPTSGPPPPGAMGVVGISNQPPPPSGTAPPSGPPGPPPPGPPPPSSYEDDQHRAAVAAAAAAYGMVYYPSYGYPGQPMLPPGAPPGSYIPSPYLPPLHYTHMSHNGHPIYAHGPPPAMGGIPPHQQYMHHPPPPGAYPAPPPPPNGTGRGSMPPTPMPPHAHPYYHPSPQISHAVPYSMMMPPPPGTGSPAVPPHHSYDSAHNAPQQQVPMGHS